MVTTKTWFSGWTSRSLDIFPAAGFWTLLFRNFVMSIQLLFGGHPVVLQLFSIVVQSLFLKLCVTISFHDRGPNLHRGPLKRPSFRKKIQTHRFTNHDKGFTYLFFMCDVHSYMYAKVVAYMLYVVPCQAELQVSSSPSHFMWPLIH